MKDQPRRMGSKDYKKRTNNAAAFEVSRDGKLALLEKIAVSFEVRPKPKVVLRLLPPRITANTFLDSLEDVAARWNAEDRAMSADSMMSSILWMQLVPGRKAEGREWSKGVAYVVFATRAASNCFIKAYEGHSFIDHQGMDFKASAGLAAIQRFVVPPTAQPGHPEFETDTPIEGAWKAISYYKEHPEALTQPCYVAPDRKLGSIESDQAYLRFLERLNTPKPPKCASQPSIDKSPEVSSEGADKVSPLVKALIDRKTNVLSAPRGRRRSQGSLERRGGTYKASAGIKKMSGPLESRAGRGKPAARGGHAAPGGPPGGFKHDSVTSTGRPAQKPVNRRRFRGQPAVPTWRPKVKGNKPEGTSPSPQEGDQSPQAKAPVVLLKRDLGPKKGSFKHSTSGPGE
eukprot:Gregarina_sp_Poly_1__8019@NODE_45_length_17866_cov_75_803753_g39_i0_p6_GENE_NODE_45_length_17866_cov_75_803753_g39_i0NODE_45_length_17866_cov_75_803753_g39_i0_p6_ORF_typecomplete_len401_score49_29Smg4_UPF3/PF03467_15/1_8e20_NODE_45_length_17866_cov_75_803753_g39_i01660217804